MAVTVTLLGGFGVDMDGVAVPPEAWSRRHAAALVKLLALTPDRRLHRERVIDALWPGLDIASAAPRLHKAAHYARRALGDDESVILRNDMVVLLGGADVVVDAEEFRRTGEAAIAEGTSAAAREALELYAGSLLPDDPYESWTHDARDAIGVLHLDLLRLAGRWEDVLREDPTDEQAHLAIIQASADSGHVRGALRQFERMDQALRHELGTSPSAEAEQLRARLEALAPMAEGRAEKQVTRVFGRRDVGDQIRKRLELAEAGKGGSVVVSGPAGVGKSAVLDMMEAIAHKRGWRSGRGTASEVEGPWPYAPVLEALSDMCRKHPALCDGLPDVYRRELARALSGRDVSWSGESAHQRLFVAAAELIRLASVDHGLLIVVDDLHEADDASLRLLHYLSRCAVTERVLIVVAHRPTSAVAFREVVDSLIARTVGTRITLSPLSESATRRMLAEQFPDLATETVSQIWRVSAGLPFTVLEMARNQGGGANTVPTLPAAALRTFERVALLGSTFTTDELLAVSGASEDDAYQHLEMALAALVVEPADLGYRFRHALVREALLHQMPASVTAGARRDVARALEELGAPPGRVAHQYLAAGLPSRAVPFALRAVETAGALGAYRDALSLVDLVREHTGPADLPRLLARRGDLLMALGDPGAVPAYQEAVAVTTGTEHRLVRARLARAAAFAGDMDTAGAALAGLTIDGDAADGPILLARGNVAYFTGDIDAAWEAAASARRLLLSPDDPWHYVDLLSLQGLIAHQRGEWFTQFRQELRRDGGKPFLSSALFDAHLCVAEYLLYGQVPYAEVIELAESLRRRATHTGALRGVAFATALIGEAALLMDDLPRAETELTEAVDLHHDIDASGGEAHSLQRLAEVHLARGDRIAAERLLQRALPLARWSVIANHLLQRVYGSMIVAAPDANAARAVVDRAEATLGETDRCPFCEVMIAVPASIACAGVGDIEGARRYLASAEASAARWEGSAWDGAVLEARAHLAFAEGSDEDAADFASQAAQLFTAAGHARDAARCTALTALRASSPPSMAPAGN